MLGGSNERRPCEEKLVIEEGDLTPPSVGASSCWSTSKTLNVLLSGLRATCLRFLSRGFDRVLFAVEGREWSPC